MEGAKMGESSDRKRLPAFLLLQILTFGGLGIWVLIDFIMIVVGSFRDKEERLLLEWT
jgi:hypothetical protein